MKKQDKNSAKPQNDEDALNLNWESIFNAISTPAQIIDKNHRILAANEATLKHFNFKQEDIIGKKCNIIFYKSETTPCNCPLDKVLIENDCATETIAVDINNSTFSISCAPIFDYKGNFDAVLHIMTDISQRIIVENLLKNSEKKFRTLYHNSPDMYVSVSPIDASILQCNDTLLKNTGYTSQEIIGAPIFKMYHDDCIDEVKKAFQQFVETGVVSDKELIIKTKEGDKIEVSLNVNAVKDETGKILYSISSWRDISESKKTKKTLEENANFIESIINASPDIIYIYDILERKNVFSNDGIQLNLGYTSDEIKEMGDKVIPILMHPDDFDIYLQNIVPKYSTLQDKEIITHEYRMKDKAGNWRWLYSKESVFLRTSNGETKQIFGISNDISEQKKATETIEKNSKLLTLFVEHSPASIAMFDKEMKYIIASNRYKIDYDLGEQNLIGHSHYEIFPEMPQHWKEIHQRCLAGETIKADEDQFLRVSGKLDWVKWEIRPWYENNNIIGGIILFSEVITERKKTELELQNYREHLEELVKERTHELEEKNAKLDRINQLFVGRELRMKELKEEIENLKKNR